MQDAEKLVAVASYGSAHEAGLAQSRLLDAGIPARLDGDLTGTTLWHVGTALGGVKVLVAETDRDRAQDVLASDAGDTVDPEIPAWTCPACGEINEAGFSVCWSCGAEFEPATAGAPNGPPPSSESPDQDAAEEHLQRAWRAAVLGLVILPPFVSIYAAVQLNRYDRAWREADLHRSRKSDVTSWLILGSILFWTPWWLALFLAF